MAMTPDEVQDFRESANLLGADELRAMLGSGDEEDAIINELLAGGKAVEMKKPADTGDDGDEHPNPDDKRVDPPRKNDASDDGDEDDDDDDDDTDAAAGAAGGADSGAAAGAAAGDQGAANVGEIAPLNLGFLDTEFKAKLQGLDTQNQKDFKAMMDGTMDPEEYATKNTAYLAARDSLRDERAANAEFFTSVHSFKVQALKDGINYDIDTEKAASWDDWVKRIASNPANAKMSDAEILAAAHKKVMLEFDVTPVGSSKTAQNSGKNVSDAKKVAEKQGRAPKLDNIPPTLGGIPAAATSDGQDGGEFAHLENLSGMAYERAIAAMSPEQRERYGMM